MKSQRQFEEAAMDVLRQAARDVRVNGLPPDAGSAGALCEIVRAAWRGGREQAAAEISEAYGLMLAGNDPEIVPETLRGILPARRIVPKPSPLS